MTRSSGLNNPVESVDEAACEAADSDRDILIVEDDEHTRDALMNLVRRMGFAPRAARSAQEAISELLRSTPDVLITDWDLGSGGDGVEIASLAQDPTHHCQIVFCSGNDISALQRRTRHLNDCSYIRKPTSMDRLRQEFHAILEDH